MPKTKEQKSSVMKDLTEKIQKSKVILFTTQSGIDVKTSQDLRKKCKLDNIEFVSTKKTLLRIALKESGVENVDLNSIQGLVGVIFGYDDEIKCPNLVYNFTKLHKNLEIQAGVLDGNAVEKEIVINLAKLPSKDELLAKFVYVINGPVSGFVNVLAGTMRGFVRALDQIKEQKV